MLAIWKGSMYTHISRRNLMINLMTLKDVDHISILTSLKALELKLIRR